MLHAHKRLLMMIIVSLLFVSLALAGGRRERAQEEQPEPAPPTPRQRIEFGREVERPETQPEDEREPGLGPWILADHKLDQTLEREISGIMQQGYTPVGMEKTADGISMLYILTETVLFDRWIIHEFTDLSVLNDEFSAFLLDGWLPMGFSKEGESITTFFVRSRDTEVTSWRMHNVPAEDLEQLIEIVKAYINRGYVPYGLSIDETDNRIWLLVLETETAPGATGRQANVLINAFKESDIIEGITRDVSRGAVPWAMSRGREASFFLYLF